MIEVARELPWLEDDKWLDEQGRGPVTERRSARTGHFRDVPTRYTPLAVLIVLVTEIVWCAFLFSLGYRFFS